MELENLSQFEEESEDFGSLMQDDKTDHDDLDQIIDHEEID
jgi:hypothetical protein